MAAYKGRWPLGPRVRALLRVPRRRVEQLVSRPRPRQPPDRRRRRRRRRATTSSKDLSDKAIQFIRDAKVVDPDKPFFLYLAPRPGTRRTTFRRSGPTSTRAGSTTATRRSATRSSPARRSSGCCPRTPSCPAINPHGEPQATGPDGQPWPLLDTVRPWDSLSADEQRLFARMAEVFAGFISYTDDQLGRVIDYLEESGQLDNTIIVVVSDNGASGEGGPERHRSTSGASSTASPTPTDADAASTSTSSAARSPTTTTTPAGRGRSTRRSPTGSAGRATRAASPTCAWSSWPAQIAGPGRAAPAVHPRGRHRPDDLRPARHRAAGGDQGLQQSPIEGESFAAALTDPAAPGKRTQFYAMLGQRSIYHEGWLACTAAPADQRLGQVRPGRVGALRPRARPRAVEEPRRRRARAARAG